MDEKDYTREDLNDLEDTLEYCPFCGGAGQINETDEPGELHKNGLFYIVCLDCCVETDKWSDPNDTVDFWNRRYVPKPLAA